MTEYTHSGQPATSHGRAVLSQAAATTLAALVVATAGVVVQIVVALATGATPLALPAWTTAIAGTAALLAAGALPLVALQAGARS